MSSLTIWLATAWISLESATLYTVASNPNSFAASLAKSPWIIELSSLPQYIIATFLASGNNLCIKSNWSLTGVKSLAPVTFPPGSSLLFTSLVDV